MWCVSAQAKIVVASCCDDGYAQHLAVGLGSMVRRIDAARVVDVYIVDCGISGRNLARVRAALGRANPRATVRVIRPDDVRLPRLVAGPERLHRPAVLMRILLPDLLPAEVERVLYVDADTVTLEDVTPLFDMDLMGHALWAVEDLAAAVEVARLEAAVRAPRFTGAAAYFNGGVLLMDLARWRAAGVGAAALRVIATTPEIIKLADQDALNLGFGGDFGRLPGRWNNQIRGRRASAPEALGPETPRGILHWAGRRKPWDLGRKCLREDAYVAELVASGWLGPSALAGLRLSRAADRARLAARRLAGRAAAWRRGPIAASADLSPSRRT